MSKIQVTPSLPKEPAAPKKTPAVSAAPPFRPAQPKPPQSTPAPASTAQSRHTPARSARPPRVGMQAVPNERPAALLRERLREAATAELAADPQANTRFDSGNARLPGQFFAEFTETPEELASFGAGASLEEAMQAAALDEALDSATLARLLPAGANDGIFDVVLPSGERLGVVVSGHSSSLSYLLSPATEKFGSRLRRQRMELEERMERLTHRNVNITVL